MFHLCVLGKCFACSFIIITIGIIIAWVAAALYMVAEPDTLHGANINTKYGDCGAKINEIRGVCG